MFFKVCCKCFSFQLSHEKLSGSFTPAPKESIAQSRKSDYILGSEAVPRPEVSHSILNIESDISKNEYFR